MSPLLAAAFALFLYLLVRLLHWTQPPVAPLIYAKDRSSQFVQSVLTMCPILHQPYVPPLVWGKSGHIQTIIYAQMGRLNVPVPKGVRHSKKMPDGANLTFDLYEPLKPHPTGGEYCIIICPGIGNNSESPYIRSLVRDCRMNGYIAVVLNHLGSLLKLPLSSPRIFTYGGTEELAAVRAEVEQLHPKAKLILLGCSMGANVVIRYLGQSREHQQGILAAMSLCQGYNVNKAMPFMKSWRNLGHLYVYVMTLNMKAIMRAHREPLLAPETLAKYGVDEARVWGAKSLDELDENFTIRMHGYESLHDFYEDMSSSNYLSNIRVPLLLLNAEDDPVVPTQLLQFPFEAIKSQPHTVFVLTKHGGHLGFYERGFILPTTDTWMDRLCLEYANCITRLHRDGELPTPVFEEETNVNGGGDITNVDSDNSENNKHSKDDTQVNGKVHTHTPLDELAELNGKALIMAAGDNFVSQM